MAYEDFDPSDPFGFGSVESSSPNVTYDEKFWKDIPTYHGKNTIGLISLFGTLCDEAKNNVSGRLLDCVAIAGENSITLRDVDSPVAGSQKVFYLPWKQGEITTAKRADYESKCNYFLTAKLTGCRFVLGKEDVLHIASKAGGAQDTAEGSVVRTIEENKIIPPDAPRRRLSMSGRSHQGNDPPGYSSVAVVFGVRSNGIWIYKGLAAGKEGGLVKGEWFTFINP